MNNQTHDIERLTSAQVRRSIDERPAVIVPLGGCEPFGDAGAMGVGGVCAEGAAREVSARLGILKAPMIPVGCSTPFMSFAGAAGVRPRTFVNMLCEIAHGYIFQGVDKIFMISAAPFNAEPGAEAVRRLRGKYPDIKVLFFDINTILLDDQQIKDKNRIDRDDALLLSMYKYLCHDQSKCQNLTLSKRWIDGVSQYNTWKKRGMDPEKLRKLCPEGSLVSSSDIDISYEKGRDYFEKIVAEIERSIRSPL